MPNASTTTITIVQPASVLMYTKDVLAKILCPIKELPYSYKWIQMSLVTVSLTPKNVRMAGIAETNKPRRSSRPCKPNPHLIDLASINSSHWYSKLLAI